MSLTRRTFLGATALSLTSIACGGERKDPISQKKEAKNIIFCVADGMAMTIPTVVDQLSRIKNGKPSYWCSLMNEDYATTGLQYTSSLSSVVTDSAAASAAWGSGRHIWNGQLNMYPDRTSLKTLAEVMIEKGVKVGLVTTTTATHATPAGFAASVFSRGEEPTIAVQYLERNIDVVMGGGDRFFDKSSRQDKRDLYADYAAKGYKVVKGREEMLGMKADKILGIFSNSHLPYTVDRNNSDELAEKVPTLAEMVKVAIDNLKGSSEGFLLQIEGGKVDHAGHAADIVGQVNDQMAFEDAVKVAVEFALEDGETLVVVTSDHATGGPSLNGAGSNYFDSTAGMESIISAKASFDIVLPELRGLKSASDVSDYMQETFGYKISQAEAEALAKQDLGTRLNGFDRNYNMFVADVLANYSSVAYTSLNHTSDHVIVTAVGPGSAQFGGLTENVKFFDALLAMRGLEWSNPTMSYEDAAKIMLKQDESVVASLTEPRYDAFLA